MQLRNSKALATRSEIPKILKVPRILETPIPPLNAYRFEMKLRSGYDVHVRASNERREDKHRQRQQKTLHNASSLLLKLPPEIRMMIYGYVCGHQTIHIYRTEIPRHPIRRAQPLHTWRGKVWLKRSKVKDVHQLDHNVCSKSVSEEAEQIVFDSASASWRNRSNKCPHRHCTCGDPKNTPFDGHHAKEGAKVDISLLRTCCQIYNEANMVLYHSNIFSFQDSEALKRFTQTPQMGSIRRVRLQIRIGVLDGEYDDLRIPPSEDLILDTSSFAVWKEALSMVVNTMSNLKYIHLDLDQDSYRQPPFSRKVEDGGGDEVTKGLLILAKLPLKVATVTLRDEYQKLWSGAEYWAGYDGWKYDDDSDEQDDEESEEEYDGEDDDRFNEHDDEHDDEANGRWTMVQRQGWAKAVRDGLLSREPHCQGDEGVTEAEKSVVLL